MSGMMALMTPMTTVSAMTMVNMPGMSMMVWRIFRMTRRPHHWMMPRMRMMTVSMTMAMTVPMAMSRMMNRMSSECHYLFSKPLLSLMVLALNILVLPHELLCDLPLLPLHGCCLSLVLKFSPSALGGLLQLQQMGIVLLQKQLLLFFDLLIHHDIVLVFLRVCHCMKIVRLLLVHTTNLVSTI